LLSSARLKGSAVSFSGIRTPFSPGSDLPCGNARPLRDGLSPNARLGGPAGQVYKPQITNPVADFIAAVNVHDSAVTLTDLPIGAEIKVYVTAANETGETKPSEEVTVTLA
jgi:hypothetical protein